MKRSPSYVISGGDEGAKRLRVLGRTMWPNTEAFFRRAGLKDGLDCLDVGCGSGDVTVKLAEIAGSSARIVGVDMDQGKLSHAKSLANELGLVAEFNQSLVEDLNYDSEFDVVYCRFVLTHMTDPLAGMKKLYQAVRPGGLLLVEDIDMSSHVYHPKIPEFQRYIELYRSVVEKRGADPTIGPKLVGMFMDLDIKDPEIHVTIPTFYKGEEKSIARLTLMNIKDAIIGEGLADEQEIDYLLKKITEFENDPRSLQSTAQIFQVFGRKNIQSE